MHEYLFSIFPNEKFIDLGLYQYGWERCAPAHQFGPAARTHYLFRSKADRAFFCIRDRSAPISQMRQTHGNIPGWNLMDYG